MSLISDRLDGIQASVAVKAPVRVTTTANITLSGEQTIDGVAVSENGSGTAPDRVLVKDQTNTVDNGIYNVSTSAWSRAKDFDGARDVVQGTLIPVYAGAVNGRTTWQCATANPVRPGTSNLTFEVITDVDIAGDLANTTDSLLGDYLVGTHRTGTGAVAMRLHHWIETRVYNVKDFVDPTVSTTDWTAAINLAYARIPSAGGVLEFPEGDFAYNTALSFVNAKPFIIRGQGRGATRLRPTFAAGNALSVDGAAFFAIQDLSIVPTINRTSGTYNVYVKNCPYPSASNVFQNNGQGGLWMFEACNFLEMVNVQGDVNDNTHGDTCLRIKGSGGTISNFYFRQGPFASGGYGGSGGPTCYLTGTTTSLHFSNGGFVGGGPRSRWTVSGITSTAPSFVVTTTATHDFQAGDFLVLRGMTPSTYNGMWRIMSVTSTTITVTSTINPGASSVQGTAESVAANFYVSNEDGPVNECSISNVLFEAGQPNLAGSAGAYFDARRGAPGAKSPIQGWGINNCYSDFGSTGLILSGTESTGADDPTLCGFVINGIRTESITRGIHLDEVGGVNISGFIGNMNQSPVTDKFFLDSGGGARTTDIYIWGGTLLATRGVTITGCDLGATRSHADTFLGRSKDFGVFIDYNAQILKDIHITGNTIFGLTLPIAESAPPTVGSTMRIKGNLTSYTTFGSNLIPSIASASTININPYMDVQKITGTTNIQTINPGLAGSQVTLIFVGALLLVTGGNIAITGNYTVAAGTAVNLYSDGTSWYPR